MSKDEMKEEYQLRMHGDRCNGFIEKSLYSKLRKSTKAKYVTTLQEKTRQTIKKQAFGISTPQFAPK